MTAFRLDPERLLLPPIRIGIALVLLVPLVTAPWTLYQFTVGKAVYARVLIAVLFALWAVLALMRPGWRPPRSALLWLLAAGLAVSVLSAVFGVSPEHSFWSTYTRMQGIVNAAHWAAFALVVASVARPGADWNRLLNANLAVGLAVSLIAIGRYVFPEAPLLVPGEEGRWPRIGASAGNPILLGAYLQAIALIAAGFLVRSYAALPTPPIPAASAVDHRASRGARRRAAREARKAPPPPRGDGRARRLFWAATACCALAGVALTGSLGALAGLAAGFGAAGALYVLFGRARRSRRLGIAGLGTVMGVAAVFVLVLALRGEAPPRAFGNPMLERATSAERVGHTLGNRLRNWEAGLKAFAERPVLGWGSDNYFVASARHLSAPDGRAKVRDHAHNLFVEEAASRGAAGIAAWLALWGVTALVVLRAARRLEDPRERALAVFAGAALAGWFMQGLTSFYSAESWLQHMLLLAFLATLEARARGPASSTGRIAGMLRPLAARVQAAARTVAMRQHPGPRVLAGVLALCLAGASIGSSAAIHAGAAAMLRADKGDAFVEDVERAIDAFGPLATGPRIVLFNNIARNWEVLQRHHAEEAARLLTLADGHAAAALAAEPESWVLHHALARLHLKVGRQPPGVYGTRAASLRPLAHPCPQSRPDGSAAAAARCAPEGAVMADRPATAPDGRAGGDAASPYFFQIGFKRCGTTALWAFFNRCGIACVHHDRGRLARRMRENLAAGRAPLDGYDRRYRAFTNMDFQEEDDRFDGFRAFEALDAAYGGRFILNTRPMERWIASVMRTAGQRRVKRAHESRFGTGDPERVAAFWRAEREDHHARVLAVLPPERLLVFDIETDPPERLCEFVGVPRECARFWTRENPSPGRLGALLDDALPAPVKRAVPDAVKMPVKKWLARRAPAGRAGP